MKADEKDAIYKAFYERVNRQPKKHGDRLRTEASKSIGDKDSDESTGHGSGRRIVEFRRTAKDALGNADCAHRNMVCGYFKRHIAQRPDGDLANSNWRYALMNWGRDPMKS